MNIFQTLPEKIIAENAKAEEKVRNCSCLDRLQQKLEQKSPRLGDLFADLRRHGLWMVLWIVALSLIMLLNLFIWPEHPHFVIDIVPWFWAVFGLGIGVVMIFVMKRLIQPLIVRKEDYYGDI